MLNSALEGYISSRNTPSNVELICSYLKVYNMYKSANTQFQHHVKCGINALGIRTNIIIKGKNELHLRILYKKFRNSHFLSKGLMVSILHHPIKEHTLRKIQFKFSNTIKKLNRTV